MVLLTTKYACFCRITLNFLKRMIFSLEKKGYNNIDTWWNDYNKNIILDEFIKEFDLLYNDFIIGNNQFVNICKEHNYLLNKEINYNGSVAKIVDISEEGKLIIDINGKQEQLFFGEITLESIYNK